MKRILVALFFAAAPALADEQPQAPPAPCTPSCTITFDHADIAFLFGALNSTDAPHRKVMELFTKMSTQIDAQKTKPPEAAAPPHP